MHEASRALCPSALKTRTSQTCLKLNIGAHGGVAQGYGTPPTPRLPTAPALGEGPARGPGRGRVSPPGAAGPSWGARPPAQRAFSRANLASGDHHGNQAINPADCGFAGPGPPGAPRTPRTPWHLPAGPGPPGAPRHLPAGPGPRGAPWTPHTPRHRQLGLAPWARPDTAHPEYSLRFMRGRLDALPSCGTSSVNSVLAIMKKKLSKK